MKWYLVYLTAGDSGNHGLGKFSKRTVTHCVNTGSFCVDIALITLHCKYWSPSPLATKPRSSACLCVYPRRLAQCLAHQIEWKSKVDFWSFWHWNVKPTLAFYPKLIVVLKNGTDKVDWLGMKEKFLHERKVALLFFSGEIVFWRLLHQNINSFLNVNRNWIK